MNTATPERPPRPVLVFDGGCGFCRRWVAWLRPRTGDRLELLPADELGDRLPQLDRAAVADAAFLVGTDGGVRRGMAAVTGALGLAPGHGLPDALRRTVPGATRLGEALYRMVARHRGRLERGIAPLAGPAGPVTFVRGTRLFLLLLGLVQALWFGSLLAQHDLLLGDGGLLPVTTTMQAAREAGLGFLDLPTLAWLSATPGWLAGLGWAGILVGLGVAAGLLPRLLLAVSWLLQLSFVHVLGVFGAHTGDALLLEVTVLGLLLAAPGGRQSLPAARALLWLLWLRVVAAPAWTLLVEAGAVGPTEWLGQWLRSQPLPSASGLQLGNGASAVVAALSLVALLVLALAPVGLLLFRRLRHASVLALLMVLAGFTVLGSQGVTPWLGMAALLPFVDDRLLRRAAPPAMWSPGWGVRVASAGALALLLAIGAVVMLPASAVARVVHRFGAVSSERALLGSLPARPVLEVQASDNGQSWHPYALPFAPGAVDRRPAFVLLHLPRLEAALADAAVTAAGGAPPPWLRELARTLLDASPAVTAAFVSRPFGEALPLQVRFVMFRYVAPDAAERDAGALWQREDLGVLDRPFQRVR